VHSISQLKDGSGGTVVWQANTRDAENHLTSATLGNGTNPIFAFDPQTGRETGYATHPIVNSNNAFQWGMLTWDQLGNLTERHDVFNNAPNGLDEKYSYDELNRLTVITLNGAAENGFSYDVLGNMLSSDGVGTYAYLPTGSPQPHGVSSIKSWVGNIGFTYDADGNMTGESGAVVRTITPAIFNMTRNVTYAGNEIIFRYDADHNRALQTAPEGTTFYLPDGELTPGKVWHTYFEVDGRRVAEDYGAAGSLKQSQKRFKEGYNRWHHQLSWTLA
jgi:uncharacterized protein RhaS with RHS repeats